jgi:hypothetical protein
LLDSAPDSYSKLSGRQLVERKVMELVVMGGGYPTGFSWNMYGSGPNIASRVINDWQGRIVFVGDDVGQYVMSGSSLISSRYISDPVRDAYIYYRQGQPHSSWDPLTVIYAAKGLGDFFELGNEYGYNHIELNGTNKWIWDTQYKKQHFLRLKVDNRSAAIELDKMFLKGAQTFSKTTDGNSSLYV